MIYLTAALVNFIYIALKALQQRQVMAAEYWRMPLVSCGMAFCEVFIIGNVAISAVNGSWQAMGLMVLALGVGGGVGSVFGTWIHVRRRP